MINIPKAYFITFTCYGTWLHGAKKISVDRYNNTYDSKYLTSDKIREFVVKNKMPQAAYELDFMKRFVVLEAIKEVCVFRHWELYAAHVRTNHVHLVLKSSSKIEVTLNTIKSYASRALNKHEPKDIKFKKWTRHGSTRFLWNTISLSNAIRYVIHEQGNTMAAYIDKRFVNNFDFQD